MGVLGRILSSKRAELTRPPPEGPFAEREALDVPALLARRGAHDGGARDQLRFVTEVKFKSPSGGELSRALGAFDRATAYAEAGASAISVLCDGPFFGGGFSDLAEARRALDAHAAQNGTAPRVALLAKEFVVDEAQLDWAKSYGADAVLLIARVLDPHHLRTLHDAARARGLWPLVEVIDEAELDGALACDARLIGVNARDLDSLAMDSTRTARVLAAIPAGHVAIHLSGIKTLDDVARVTPRADAVLVGEALMRQDDPRPLLRSFVAAPAPA